MTNPYRFATDRFLRRSYNRAVKKAQREHLQGWHHIASQYETQANFIAEEMERRLIRARF